MATFIHGIGASENIDSSGEVVSISGLDVSSLDKDGVFNYEHKSDIPAQVVGKILKVKKIFSDADCEDDHQMYFWNKCKTPYLYVMGELFDDYSDSAREVAGRFKYDADHKNQNERTVMNFSVEGSKISKEGIVVTRSIGRKITITILPCNKVAIAEMVASPQKTKSNVDELFKTEAVSIEIFTPGPNWGLLKKENPKKFADKLGIQPFKKDMGGGQISGGASTALSGVGPTSAGSLMVGSEKNAGAQMKKAHEAIHSPKASNLSSNTPSGMRGGTSFMGDAVRRQDVSGAARREAKESLAGTKAMPKPNLPKSEEMNKAAPNLSIAKDHQRGKKIGMTSSGKEVFSHGMVGDYKNFNSKDHLEAAGHHKQMATGSKNDQHAGTHHNQKYILHTQAAKTMNRKASKQPSTAHASAQTAAPTSTKPSEAHPSNKYTYSKDPKIKKNDAADDHLNKALTAGSGIASPDRLSQGSALSKEKMGKMEKVFQKSEALQRAEAAYQAWEKREEFETFMKSRLPGLTRSEIQVIGQTMLYKAAPSEFQHSFMVKNNKK